MGPVGIRLLTRRGNDWTTRFPLVVEAVNHLRVRSCLIDGEVVCCDERGLARFDVLRRRRNEAMAFLDAQQVERGITAFARAPNGGLIVLAQPRTLVHRGSIIKFANEHQLPAVYNSRLFTAGGGLISYGPDILDQYRRAAEYVDRILKGAKPTDLPVQAPTKFDLVINLKTAKALGITMPPSLLLLADEVIQ
jgi:hypothetical protein